ncbi:unnamed protein product [Prunus brigantina]
MSFIFWSSETDDGDLDLGSLGGQWKKSEQIKGIDIEFPQGESSETARLNLGTIYREPWKRWEQKGIPRHNI